jgi:phospholipid/cholesterol/gamma-HCH transport system substrate-binding protein
VRTVGSAVTRLLLVLAVVILAVYAIVQAINRPVGGSVETYRAEFSDVFGLRKNADVRIRGVQVGKVTDIELQSSGNALVEFTVQESRTLTGRDRLSIRFQSLVGQRYLAIAKDEETQGDPGQVPYDSTIPMTMTTGSFDITRLFNGLRPILQGADPEVFNTFATNMLHLVQGDEGVGIGDVLGDIDRLTRYAADKREVISVIVTNLGVVSEQLEGKSEIVETLMENMAMLFDTLEVNLERLKSAFGGGADVYPPIVQVLESVFDLGLGGHDNLTARLLEAIPDTAELTDTLSVVPTVTRTLNASMNRVGFDDGCSQGNAELPDMGEVLLGGGRLTLCNG